MFTRCYSWIVVDAAFMRARVYSKILRRAIIYQLSAAKRQQARTEAIGQPPKSMSPSIDARQPRERDIPSGPADPHSLRGFQWGGQKFGTDIFDIESSPEAKPIQQFVPILWGD